MKIVAAGNTEIPAILALEKKGAQVASGNEVNLWSAKYLNNTYIAESPLELLGLIEMHTARGAEWKATDSELERCAIQYPGLGLN